MFDSGIYAILDTDRLGWSDPQQLRAASEQLVGYTIAAAEGGAVALQLRCKSLPVADPLRRTHADLIAASLQRLPRPPLPLVIDDDLAAAVASCSGLHWGQADGDPATARTGLGTAPILGWSTHTLEQVAAAQGLPVDYLGFGPVRPTWSKQRAEPATGWAQLADAAHLSRLPVVAIGGLEAADAALVRASGAHAMAVIGAWLGPPAAPWPIEAAYRAMTALVAAWRSAPSSGVTP
jgi:thiamine-phosphate pyrophosphorylase